MVGGGVAIGGVGLGLYYITHTPTHPLHTVMYTIKYSMMLTIAIELQIVM